jgi:hypothetical protein
MMLELHAAYLVLTTWKENPTLSKKQIGVWSHWKNDTRPLTEDEVDGFKRLLREHALTQFRNLFPEDNG